MKEKLLIVGLLSILSLSVLVRSEIVEDHKDHIGYTLIKQLYEDTGTAIEELDDQWSKQSVLLQSNINSWQQTVVDQQALCNRRKQDLKNTLKEISKTEHFIEWIAARVRDNDARVERLQELRCRANNLYIDSIKNHRLTLTLVEYLINEINNVQNVEMLQQSQTMTKLSMFINAYKLGSVSHLLDAPVYADFKKHLQQQAINMMEQKSSAHQQDNTDGEDGETEFSEDEEANQNALREIEHELNSDTNSGSDDEDTYSVGSENDEDGECDDDEEEGSASNQTRRTSEEGGARHTHHGEECTQIHDGEFLLDEDDDDEESDDEDDSDDEEEDDDDTVSTPAAPSSSAGSDESEGDSTASAGSEDSAEGDNDNESSGDSDSGSDEDNAAHESEIKALADEDGETDESDGAQIYGGNQDWNNEQSGTQGGESGAGYHFDGVVKDWPTYKHDILAILTELKENIIQTMRQAQDDEVLAGIALADFKLFIERENRGLERDQADQEEHLENLRTLQKKTEWKIDDCLAEYQTDQDALYVANNEYDGTEVQYQENRAAQVAEREIYEYVLGLYEGRINAYNEPAYSPEDFNDLDDDTPVVGDGETDGETDGEQGNSYGTDGEDGEDGEAYYVEEEYVVEEEIEELVDEDDF